MTAFIKQLGTLVAGQMAGSNNKASFIVKTLRTTYVINGSLIAVIWYSAWRNERVQPGKVSFPFPGFEDLKRQFSPDRPEKELERQQSPNESSIQAMTGAGHKANPTALVGPITLNRGIAKANELSGKYPYVWGGGHSQVGVPTGGGYDCSGAVSAVLGAMGLLNAPLVSGDLANFGQPGEGSYITIYANPVHTFMKININGTWRWFGTGDAKKADRGGPAWGNHDSSLQDYSVRHPKGY